MSGARILMLAGLLLVAITIMAFAIPSDWEGVDVAVIETKAREAGVEPAAPLLNITGDFQLFLFTLSGAIGGFIIGYSWKSLFGTQVKSAGAPSKSETAAHKEG